MLESSSCSAGRRGFDLLHNACADDITARLEQPSCNRLQVRFQVQVCVVASEIRVLAIDNHIHRLLDGAYQSIPHYGKYCPMVRPFHNPPFMIYGRKHRFRVGRNGRVAGGRDEGSMARRGEAERNRGGAASGQQKHARPDKAKGHARGNYCQPGVRIIACLWLTDLPSSPFLRLDLTSV